MPIHRIGVEIESIVRCRAEMINHFPWKPGAVGSPIRTITRDASVESVMRRIAPNTTLFMGNKRISESLIKRYGPNDEITGFEIVTNPLELHTMKGVIKKCLSVLVKSGEILSPRSSIHVHIEFPTGLIFLKSATALGLKVEPLLYKIAGMGKEYRGVINESIYAKPLALPPAILLNRVNQYALISPQGALLSDGITEFWNMMGISPTDRDRYRPLRYFGINLYSTLLRNTIEYRVFNLSTVSRDVESIISLCQFLSELMVRIAFKEIEKLPSISLTDPNENKDYIDLLDQLMDLGEFYDCDFQIGDDEYQSIKWLIIGTPQPIFKKNNILTHLPNYMMDSGEAESYGLEMVSNVLKSGHLDIHNFQEQDRSLI